MGEQHGELVSLASGSAALRCRPAGCFRSTEFEAQLATSQAAVPTSDSVGGIQFSRSLQVHPLLEGEWTTDELLQLDVEYLDLANREAQIIGKGGSAERVFWDSAAARLLAKHVAGRQRGPVFLADKAPSPARQPAACDIDQATGCARLSYRRAAEVFKAASAGRTLHKLRHSRLTHYAEDGEDVTLIKAKSRHRSLRSLERYVNPGNRAVADLTDRDDPNR